MILTGLLSPPCSFQQLDRGERHFGQRASCNRWIHSPSLTASASSSANVSSHHHQLQDERATERESLIHKRSPADETEVRSVQYIINSIILKLYAQFTSHFRKHRNLFDRPQALSWIWQKGRMTFSLGEPTSWSCKELYSAWVIGGPEHSLRNSHSLHTHAPARP